MNKIFIYTILIISISTAEIKKSCKTIEEFDRINKKNMNGLTLKELTSELDQSNVLGTGANGVTFNIKWGSEPQFDAALKLIDSKLYSSNLLAEEIDFLKDANSKRIVNFLPENGIKIMGMENTILKKENNSVPKFYDCAYEISLKKKKIKIFIIQEKLKNDLKNTERRNVIRNLAIENKIQFYHNLFFTLKTLQDNELVHNDIKPANIMEDYQNNLKLIDFGMSGKKGKKANDGTRCYQFPRKASEINNNFAYDIYSMAITSAVLEYSPDIENSEVSNKKAFSYLCYEYIMSCYNGFDTRMWESSLTSSCQDMIFEKVKSVMIKSFGTEDKNKEEYNLKDCKDVGCIILSCLKFEVRKMPSLSNVLDAFNKISIKRNLLLV